MKPFSLFVILSCLALTGCFSTIPTASKPVPTKEIENRYADKLEPGSSLVTADYYSMVEKTTDGKFVKKQFFPETKQIISFETFSDSKLSTLDGIYKSWRDDGSPSSEGTYLAGKRVGDWVSWSLSGMTNKGKYIDNKQAGIWVDFDSTGKKRFEINLVDGKPLGPFKNWDASGELVREGEWGADKIEWQKVYKDTYYSDQVFSAVEEKPLFPGCSAGSADERKVCAETKMLQFIYSNIKYPKFARENGIEGTAYVHFIVDENGNLSNIKCIRGLSKDISQECERVIRSMPKWEPGKQDGRNVKVRSTIPIKFKLE